MIGRLTGRVVEDDPTGILVLDVQGVGYELSCPIGTIGRAKRSDDQVILHVHTNLRQDALELFGFCSAAERSTFRQLVTVPNVGPRLALSVLNVLPTDELARAVEAEDKARLGKVPGVGKKTAERLVLELRGKLSLESTSSAAMTTLSTPSQTGEQIVKGLTGLGYKTAEAERAAQTVLEENTSTDLSTLLRAALEVLGR